MNATIPVAILVRVSTDKQSTDRQISELQAAADANGWQVALVVREDGISGRTEAKDREGLITIEHAARSGTIRKVLVHEISRLARRNSIVHGFVERMEDMGVSVYWHSQRIETLLPDGKRNPAAAIMLALLAEMARAEVETLRDRIKSGLLEARAKGVVLGRPLGTGVSDKRFIAKHAKAAALLRGGMSVRHVAAITKRAPGTIQRLRKVLGINATVES